jgi:hypothetical protein
MPRRVFYSFHYEPDSSRAAQVRNIGAIDKSSVATDNDWETIKKGGDTAIQRWIDNQMLGRSCMVLLIGSASAGRKWIKYEIKNAWARGLGIVGIYIHKLKDFSGNQSPKGQNPVSAFTLKNGTIQLDSVIKCYDSITHDSALHYNWIKDNLEKWIEEAITIRGRY